MKLVALLDTDERAMLLGYSKMLFNMIKSLMKKLQKGEVTLDQARMQMAFAGILTPSSDVAKLEELLPCTI